MNFNIIFKLMFLLIIVPITIIFMTSEFNYDCEKYEIVSQKVHYTPFPPSTIYYDEECSYTVRSARVIQRCIE